jgi:hypothetical protein
MSRQKRRQSHLCRSVNGLVLCASKSFQESTNVNVEIGVVDVKAVGGLLEVLRNVRSMNPIIEAMVV